MKTFPLAGVLRVPRSFPSIDSINDRRYQRRRLRKWVYNLSPPKNSLPIAQPIFEDKLTRLDIVFAVLATYKRTSLRDSAYMRKITRSPSTFWGQVGWLSLACLFFFNESASSQSTTPESSPYSNGIMVESWGSNDSNGNTITLPSLLAQSSAAPYRTIATSSFIVKGQVAPGFVKASGWIVPTKAGSYTFTLSGTNQAQLYLSTDGAAANKTSVATVNSGSQTTSTIMLRADTRYYFELYLQTTQSSDQASVRWTLPDGQNTSAIPVLNLVPNTQVGGVLWEFWTNIYDQALSSLLTSQWYPQ